ncbi:MAG: succinyl-diaminopimelate desuccinylase [Candidatus Methanomethylophilaceae archaeon]|nr:succinyl-diaminopimelate desuccinylase [Candidatus Methanomethylophilaceae archaeon]MDI3541307.1 succinyl-diaminopimelate desuccinylase [Candidatus Methanomethylophilaceae archaeon]
MAMTAKRIFQRIDNWRDEMIDSLMRMIRIPALGPMNGGQGEGERADMVQTLLQGFDSIRRLDAEDVCPRPNIVAQKGEGEEGIVWIVSHLDTVPPGDLSAWRRSPWDPFIEEGRIYGLGAEDDGQAIISSIYAARAVDLPECPRRGIGLAIVSDEETLSLKGIQYLIDKGVFGDKDIFIVPDWGLPDGSMVEVAEKHLIWLSLTVHGRQVHASRPEDGLNAVRVGSELMIDILDRLESEYGDKDPLFVPSVSTFEPTRRESTVDNINTVPGRDRFFFDIRLLPRYDPEELVSFVNKIADMHAVKTGAKIEVEVVQLTKSGRPSGIDSEGYYALAEAIREVHGVEPKAVGIGGGTCANFFRLRGWDAYVWQSSEGKVHRPNEYCLIENLVDDAKTFALMIQKLI